MIAAAQYYDQQLLIKYGIIPFANMMVMARYKERQAVLQNRKSIQRIFFRQLRNRASLQIAERRHEEMYRMQQAEKYRANWLLKNCLKEMRAEIHEGRREVRENQMSLAQGKLRFLLAKWQAQIPNLKAERVLREAEEKEKCDAFRRKRYGRMFLQCLRVEGEERRIENEKNQFKQAMWSKVNSWLTEIDSRQGAAGTSQADEERKGDSQY